METLNVSSRGNTIWGNTHVGAAAPAVLAEPGSAVLAGSILKNKLRRQLDYARAATAEAGIALSYIRGLVDLADGAHARRNCAIR